MKDAMEASHRISTDLPPEGFTIRDHFATIALTELIAHRLDATAERKALEAYQIADSMMRQRQRGDSGC